MPEQERSHWDASGRNGYTAVDRYKGEKCQEFVERFNSKKNAERIASHLNSAYQRGREEMMEELVYLARHEGGLFYINQMLIAASGPMDPVIITRYRDLVSKFPNVDSKEEQELDDLRTQLGLPDPFAVIPVRDLREDSVPYYSADDKQWEDSYTPGATPCVNPACYADRPHSHVKRDIRSSVIPLDHEPTLGCCAEHFNASPGNPVSP